ncbi:MAG: hypothetical protein JNM47_14610 [Hyphomonadaceae bacterium]|nr:hypothetical protein [Hyphomonadaceae bacterium]
MRLAVATAGLALFAAAALAQDASPPPPLAERLPRPREAMSVTDGGVHAQAFAFSGREDRIASAKRAPPVCETLPDIRPLDHIVERAREAQVVIINEAHDSPRDRRFIADLATELAKLGFQTYAAETLDGDAPRTPGAFARAVDGYYLREPVFGALFRQIAALGYTVVPYEDFGPRIEGRHFTDAINARETVQSSNLINRTVRLDPAQKVLVHVGHSHNRETVNRFDGRDVRWMALRFREITGVDPLTIDLTTYGAEADGVCAPGPGIETDRDIYIARAPLTFERNRPAWRVATGARFVDIPQDLRQPGARTIIEARYANEPDDAVPVDRVLVDPGEDIPLLLPPGRYKVRGWTGSGGWSEAVALTVAAPRAAAPSKAKTKQRRKTR